MPRSSPGGCWAQLELTDALLETHRKVSCRIINISKKALLDTNFGLRFLGFRFYKHDHVLTL